MNTVYTTSISASRRLVALTDPARRYSIVTGATRGIGRVVAEGLARAGHVVVMPTRRNSDPLCDALRDATGNPHVYWVPCDLASLSQVRSAAAEIISCVPRVDDLVNNAGIFVEGYAETEDGFERHLAVNYLAPFLFTHCLLPQLEASEGRVVNVAGETARVGCIKLDDLNRRRAFSTLGAYAQAKLALLFFTRSLAARAPRVRFCALTPGVAATSHLAAGPAWLDRIWRRLPGPDRAGRAVLARVLDESPPAGAPYYVGRTRMVPPFAVYRAQVARALYATSAEMVDAAKSVSS